MFLVVCYDIVEDRRRARLFRQMKDFLPRVQKSVFEGPLSDARYYILLTIIKKEIDHQTDTVRIYQLCARCIYSIDIIGTGSWIDPEPGDLVI